MDCEAGDRDWPSVRDGVRTIDQQAYLGADREQLGVAIRDDRFHGAVRLASASVERLPLSSSCKPGRSLVHIPSDRAPCIFRIAFGRSRALFLNGLGFRQDHPDVLRRALLQHAADNAVCSVQLTPFGAKYLIEGRISGPTGAAATIRSVWFVTAYPLRGTQR